MPDDNEKKKNAGQLYEALTLGFLFPVSIGVGYGIGYGLDHVFHSKPWMTIIFTVIGIAGAFVQLFRAGSSSDGG
jgi:F0F1-type ATP synthase assembly protein I